METNVIYSIFLFIIIPLLLTVLFADSKSRKVFSFLIIGITVCLLASELNNVLLETIGKDYEYYSTTISPIVEEVLKAIPLIFTIFFILDNLKPLTCLSLGLAVGVGFAIFENIIIFFQNGSDQTLLWSFARGIGAGFMHGLCGGALGLGIYFVKNYKKGYFFGLLGILSTIIIYHGIYNIMVQSDDLIILGVFFPVITTILLIPISLFYKKGKLNELNPFKSYNI